MNKFLLALNPEQAGQEVFDFACYISKLAHAGLTGVCLYVEPIDVDFPVKSKLPAPAGTSPSRLLAQALSHFKDSCTSWEVGCFLHKEYPISVDGLIKESRFSDVLIIPADLSADNGIEPGPSALNRYVIAHSDCPVILAPVIFEEINEIVFTYDGSKASVFAMRQFSYLFPEFHNSNITILSVNADKDTLADETMLIEWLKVHYKHIRYSFYHGDPVDNLVKYLITRTDAFVVIGTHNRKSILRLLVSGTILPVSKKLVNPIFIAHN